MQSSAAHQCEPYVLYNQERKLAKLLGSAASTRILRSLSAIPRSMPYSGFLTSSSLHHKPVLSDIVCFFVVNVDNIM
jgi:hypothetical protein